MKALIIYAVWMLFCTFASAEDKLMTGGSSPDDKLEVRISHSTHAKKDSGSFDAYSINLHAAKAATRFYTLHLIWGRNTLPTLQLKSVIVPKETEG